MSRLPLFDWAEPPQPVWRGAARYGFRIYHPCACGRTHSGIYLSYPWEMPSLRHWRISAASEHTAAMMPERHTPQEATA